MDLYDRPTLMTYFLWHEPWEVTILKEYLIFRLVFCLLHIGQRSHVPIYQAKHTLLCVGHLSCKLHDKHVVTLKIYFSRTHATFSVPPLSIGLHPYLLMGKLPHPSHGFQTWRGFTLPHTCLLV